MPHTKATCEIFRCAVRSLKRWVQIWDEQETLARKEREKGAYKVSIQQVNFIKAELKRDLDMMINTLHQKLLERFPEIPLNRQYIHDIIRDNNITRKRAVKKHFPDTFRGQPRDKATELRAFFDVINRYDLKDIISIDETAVRPGMGFSYCRNDLGKRCIMRSSSNEIYKKYSLIVAISSEQCLGYQLYEKGAVNGERFEEFLQAIANRNRNKLFVVDTAQIHKRDSVKRIIRESGNRMLYTLPYSPRLNPIEQFFNQLKFHMKVTRAMTLATLHTSVRDAVAKVRAENYHNYFAYAYDRRQLTRAEKGVSTKHRSPKIYKP